MLVLYSKIRLQTLAYCSCSYGSNKKIIDTQKLLMTGKPPSFEGAGLEPNSKRWTPSYVTKYEE